MLALRRARMAASPPILRGAFRPFFFLGPLWAVAALTLWLLTLAGEIVLPTVLDPLAWHRHEMLFGFVGAVIAGFLLTAIPNWTGRLPIAGMPLAMLTGLWLMGRLGVLFSALTGPVVAAAIDVGFYCVLAAVAAREVIAAKNRNLPVVALVLLFGIANALDHAAGAGVIGDPDLGWRAAITLVVLMISLIGGRIIPSFTRNWMAKQGMKDGLPGQPTRFDLVVIGVTGIALLVWTVSPEARVVPWLLSASGALQLVRMSRWRGWRTLRDPLVLILHIGYLWIPTGLLLIAAVGFGALVSRSAAIHALTAGAMATMILAVMSRATLGHTGRPLKADAGTVLAYTLITFGALLRIGAPSGVFDYNVGMEIAGLCWGGAFLVFLAVYGPMLFAARVDNPSG
ncbi:NnrS family protein [Sphingobium fluviale]|uniref:NnrS family protein n=3 Tax=Alphaproteobacteria TaxID=28211 RepID=A0A4Q1KDK8_9SPHN|nr:NnrS family protein [Sphingomonas paucimobilis]RXR26000.1 NnrS family protein [Sphingobium fluviale]BAV66674.1 hypothetical protein SCLO_3000070 [Sphingobium cloacae]